MIDDKIFLILPTKNPTISLLKIINSFEKKIKILIIDDGSDDKIEYFDIIKKKKILVLRNKINKGKGFSIKKAFKFLLKKNIKGCIVADTDGQHSIKDIKKIYNIFNKNRNKIIIGQRTFVFGKVPFRNYIGNQFSKILFNFIYRKSFKDTQCGLRAIPKKIMKKSTNIKKNDYSFEMEFLIKFCLDSKNTSLLNIKTIYRNNISYFNPVADSISVLKSFFK